MYWHDYKTEKPEPQTLCFVEFEDVNHKPYYKVLKYIGRPGAAWQMEVGHYDDGGMTTRWVYLCEVTTSIHDQPRSFFEEAQNDENDFKERLADGYWQITNKIEKLEKALITSDCIAVDEKKLLHEQRKVMLAYKDVLFRRCCLNEVDLYRDTTTQTAI